MQFQEQGFYQYDLDIAMQSGSFTLPTLSAGPKITLSPERNETTGTHSVPLYENGSNAHLREFFHRATDFGKMPFDKSGPLFQRGLENLELNIESYGAIEMFGLDQKGDPRCGAAIYHRISSALGSPMSASKMFNSHGIPGLIYKGTRAETAGPDIPDENILNFVIWNNDAINVLRSLHSRDEADVRDQTTPWIVALDEEDKNWDFVIDRIKGPRISKDAHNFTVLSRIPLVYQMLVDNHGKSIKIKDQPIEMEIATIYKVIAGYEKFEERKAAGLPQHKHQHELLPDSLRGLPSKLANPLMIFRTSGNNRSFTAVIDFTDREGAQVIVPIDIEDDNGRYIALSTYGRMNTERTAADYTYFYKMIHNKTLAYIDREIGATQRILDIASSTIGEQTYALATKEEFESLLNATTVIQRVDLVKERERFNNERYQYGLDNTMPLGSFTLPTLSAGPYG